MIVPVASGEEVASSAPKYECCTFRGSVAALDTETGAFLHNSQAGGMQFDALTGGGKINAKMRRLDGRDPAGPKWIEMPDEELLSTVKGMIDEKGWNFELSLGDSGRGLWPSEPGQIELRIDYVPSNMAPADPFLPRALTNVQLVMERSAGLPDKLVWHSRMLSRNVVPGEKIKIRHTFNGSNDLKIRRLEMRGEGEGFAASGSFGYPFPLFDEKGRAFIDYATDIAANASQGWRIHRGDLSFGDGVTGVTETSFRVAPLVDFDLPKDVLPFSDKERVVRIAVSLQSNSTMRLDGYLHMSPPDGWAVRQGNDKPFIVYYGRQHVRRVFEIVIPKESAGLFPLTFTANIGPKTVTAIRYMSVRSK